jgi:hypothetical protein
MQKNIIIVLSNFFGVAFVVLLGTNNHLPYKHNPKTSTRCNTKAQNQRKATSIKRRPNSLTKK